MSTRHCETSNCGEAFDSTRTCSCFCIICEEWATQVAEEAAAAERIKKAMSYEHCEKHDCEATNGCALCRLEEEQPNIQAAPAPRREGAACAVPITDIVACTRPRGHEGNHLSHGHDYGAPSCPACLAPDSRGLSGLPCITNMVACHPVTVTSSSEDGEVDNIYVNVASGFTPDDFVAVVADHELRALGQLALTAQEAEKQRAGAVRHLEAVRAELVKVTADRDFARADYHKLLDAVESSTNDRRRRLPAERQGVTHAFAIHTPEGRHKGYITVGLYDDGSVGEVFLKLDQQGSQVSGFCDAWSIAVSMLLQTGTSLETVCRKFRGARFEPSGRTETPGIRVALSPVDYAARYLERRFVSKLPLTDDDAGPPAEGEV